jgi:hypothetical protein
VLSGASSGDPLIFVIDPLLFFAALATSYVYVSKLNREIDRHRGDEPVERRPTTHTMKKPAWN